MEIWPDVGATSGWLGGTGENWERGPYYARGLLALAQSLEDPALLQRANAWIEWSLQSQRDDGYFGPSDNTDWWPRMPMLDAWRWHFEASGDTRVVPAMSRYLRYLREHLRSKPLEMWGKPRGGDNLDATLWLYNQTSEPSLLELADLLHEQTSDWLSELQADHPSADAFDFGHGVNRAMGLKEPSVYFQRSRDLRHLAALRPSWNRLLEEHGQVHGLYSGDEFLHGRGSTQGTELCTIVELLASFETVLRISGELWIADAIERIAFNAFPATIAADHRSHQYFQLPNQIECTPGNRTFTVSHETDLLFGPATGYGCCAANFHIGWPRLVDHLWWSTRDGGLAALLFAPSEVTALVAGRRWVTIIEDTHYPFDDEIRFEIRVDTPVRFPLQLRVPSWAGDFSLSLNGMGVAFDWAAATTEHGLACGGRAVRVDRTWANGDVLTLRLPMDLRVTHWERSSIAIERGPLVFALRIGEHWLPVGGHPQFPDYEVHPTTPWNYGLLVDPKHPAESIHVEHSARAAQPWSHNGAGIRLQAAAKRLAEWKVENGASGPIPESNLAPNVAVEQVSLVPYGCARLRISMFTRVE